YHRGTRRGAGAVERAGLENRKPHKGSWVRIPPPPLGPRRVSQPQACGNQTLHQRSAASRRGVSGGRAWCATYHTCARYGASFGRVARNASRSRSSAVSARRSARSGTPAICVGSSRAAASLTSGSSATTSVVDAEELETASVTVMEPRPLPCATAAAVTTPHASSTSATAVIGTRRLMRGRYAGRRTEKRPTYDRAHGRGRRVARADAVRAASGRGALRRTRARPNGRHRVVARLALARTAARRRLD